MRTRWNPENLRRGDILLSTTLGGREKERKEEYITSVCQVFKQRQDYKRRNLNNFLGTDKEKRLESWTSKFRRKEIGEYEWNS